MVRVVFGGSVVRNRTLQRYEKNRQRGDSVLFFSSLRHPLRPIRSEVRSQRRKVAHLPFFSYLCPERCGAAETGRKSGAVATPYRGILIRFCHETLIDDAAARGRNGCCRGPRGLPARRRVAFLFQGGGIRATTPAMLRCPTAGTPIRSGRARGSKPRETTATTSSFPQAGLHAASF